MVLEFRDIPGTSGVEIKNVAIMRRASMRDRSSGNSTTPLDKFVPEDYGARMISVRPGETTEAALAIFDISYSKSQRIELQIYTQP